MTNPARAPRVCDSVQKSEEVMSDDILTEVRELAD